MTAKDRVSRVNKAGEGLTRLQVLLPASRATELRLRAAAEDRSQGALIAEALEQYLSSRTDGEARR